MKLPLAGTERTEKTMEELLIRRAFLNMTLQIGQHPQNDEITSIQFISRHGMDERLAKGSENNSLSSPSD